MNRDQYLIKQRQLSEKSAKSYGRNGSLPSETGVPSNSQAQGPILPDPTDKVGESVSSL